MGEFVGSVDQGTTSTRCVIFDHQGREVARCQLEHAQLLPAPGRVEHDPLEILARVKGAVAGALARARLGWRDLAAIGLTNQRETTVIWDPVTGRPYLNAIVWQDLRSEQFVAALEATGHGPTVRGKTGLPLATYFSAGKIRWALDNVDGLAAAAARGRAVFGTIDTWLLWNLTGGPRGGRHITDVTNASRTQLMNLQALAWDDELLTLFGVPMEMLPEIGASSGDFGWAAFSAKEEKIPVRASLGDQHAAMVGQVCTRPGEAKNTYGTGSFLLVNTGTEPRWSHHGLITTMCYQLAGDRPTYALEGSIAVTGAAVQWLRDQLGVITSASEVEQLASTVPDSGGVYFVPAFSGLFAPYWRSDARGAIVGLTRSSTRAHLARATLEAICFQTRDVLLALEEDMGGRLECLKVDGGVTANDLCMQLQADICGVPVSKPAVAETTALGAAYAAGCAAGLWSGLEELRQLWAEERRWEPAWDATARARAYQGWQKAVQQAIA
ncbi:MAG TPA: glycerol kinase GlpK [Acidimicrobiales bacterium]|nr:glycerol kinase GlpK [Acidimicrobiales bacterium]